MLVWGGMVQTSLGGCSEKTQRLDMFTRCKMTRRKHMEGRRQTNTSHLNLRSRDSHLRIIDSDPLKFDSCANAVTILRMAQGHTVVIAT